MLGGVLCGLTALCANGLFSGLGRHLTLPKGYYSALHILCVLGFMALARMAAPSNSATIPPANSAKPSMVRVEIDHEGSRVSSPKEADEVAALIEEMLDGGVSPGEIGVGEPFRSQAARVWNFLHFECFAKWTEINK